MSRASVPGGTIPGNAHETDGAVRRVALFLQLGKGMMAAKGGTTPGTMIGVIASAAILGSGRGTIRETVTGKQMPEEDVAGAKAEIGAGADRLGMRRHVIGADLML